MPYALEVSELRQSRKEHASPSDSTEFVSENPFSPNYRTARPTTSGTDGGGALLLIAFVGTLALLATYGPSIAQWLFHLLSAATATAKSALLVSAPALKIVGVVFLVFCSCAWLRQVHRPTYGTLLIACTFALLLCAAFEIHPRQSTLAFWLLVFIATPQGVESVVQARRLFRKHRAKQHAVTPPAPMPPTTST